MLVDDCGENIIRCDYIVDGVIRRRDIEVGVSLMTLVIQDEEPNVAVDVIGV